MGEMLTRGHVEGLLRVWDASEFVPSAEARRAEGSSDDTAARATQEILDRHDCIKPVAELSVEESVSA